MTTEPTPLKWGDNPWKEAVIDACVINCIGWDEGDPTKTVQTLLHTEAAMAGDPKVNGEVKALIDAAYHQGLERGLRGANETLRQAVEVLHAIMRRPSMLGLVNHHAPLMQLLTDALYKPDLNAHPAMPETSASDWADAERGKFYRACSQDLLLAGKPYPRTCARCGLGPCNQKP